MSHNRRFIVVDLGNQLHEHKRLFAVWDQTVDRFWKINGHQVWERLDVLLQDFEMFPAKVQHDIEERDDIAVQAVVLGVESP